MYFLAIDGNNFEVHSNRISNDRGKYSTCGKAVAALIDYLGGVGDEADEDYEALTGCTRGKWEICHVVCGIEGKRFFRDVILVTRHSNGSISVSGGMDFDECVELGITLCKTPGGKIPQRGEIRE